MTARCLFLTHPEVVVDPSTPVTRWSLSDVGRARAHTFARVLVGQGWELIVSSEEQKAVETAEILGEALGLPVANDPELGENDRSATGFLPPEEFERTADRFFARPDEAVRGWETAASAQRRIVAAVRRVSAAAPGRRIVFVGHGAVGGLLLGDLTDLPISRELDQPRQGSWFAFDPTTWSTNDSWRALPEG
ncbi:histidine phosphatase family protein [Nocardioides seonyuensis]|uniref:Histidine phosphatase family protein n=1 Tax=Nocardioides seonyuensis TaxID=2518371 RepID=A0A4V1BM25_9ACTN|nr:histidine phosphatase family protein [Nocardioides seonyuensis]QBX54892.1 histidine phosphatase family protein [Nocardioides seonyuensis]